MAAHIGNITAALLVRVGDGEPVEIGTMDLPVTLAAGAGGHLGTLVVDPALFRASLARAYADADDLQRRRSADGHTPPSGPSGVSRP